MHAYNRNRIYTLLAIGLILALLTAGLPARQASAARIHAALPASAACTGLGTGTVTCSLWAKTGTLSLPGGVTVPVWGYAETSGGAAQVPGPVLVANAGDTVNVTLTNNLSEKTALAFDGQAVLPDLAGIAPGSSKTYQFIVTSPGTYLYEAGLMANSHHQVALGLYGALVVRPAGAPNQLLADAATAFDEEALVLMSEIDPALNNSASPAAFDMRNYAPTYFLINGKAHPDTLPVVTAAGHKVLLRYLNAGLQTHVPALLGMYQTFYNLDGAALPFPRTLTSELLDPGMSGDAIAVIPAAAVDGSQFALYDGSLLLHNNGGAPMGGMLTFLQIPTGVPGGDTLGPVTTTLAASPNPSTGAASVTLNGSASDASRGGSNIAAAEYFIETAGANGAGKPMSAADGSFNSVTEAITAVIPSADLAGLSTGTHPVYVHSKDAANNWGSFNLVYLNIDKGGPMTGAIAFTPPTSSGTVAVNVQATADDSMMGGSDIAAAEYQVVDAGDNSTFSGTLSVNQVAPVASLNGTITAANMGTLSEGAHTFSARSQDAFGNWGGWATKALPVDKSGPGATGVAAYPNPNNGTVGVNSITPSVRVDVKLSDPLTGAGGGAQSNISSAEGFIDTVGAAGTGFPFTPLDGAFNMAVEDAYAFIPLSTINTLAEGPHTIHVRGKDAAGNWGMTGTTTLIVDKGKPGVTGQSASPNPTGGAATITLTATAIDPVVPNTASGSKIAAAEWFVGADPGLGFGTPMQAADGSFSSATEGLTASINVTAWPLGANTIYLRAKDAAGNWSATVSVAVNVQQSVFLFSDGFESGSFSAWSGGFTRATVTTAARRTGNYGMQSVISGNTPGYASDNTPAAEPSYHARFYFNPRSTTGTNPITIFAGLNSAGTAVVQVQYRRTNTGQYQVRGAVLRSGGTTTTNWFAITNNAFTAIEIDWSSATASSFRFYTGGTLRQTLTNLNTSAYKIDTARLGPSAGLATGMSGTPYFDDFASTRTTYIGP